MIFRNNWYTEASHTKVSWQQKEEQVQYYGVGQLSRLKECEEDQQCRRRRNHRERVCTSQQRPKVIGWERAPGLIKEQWDLLEDQG